MTLQVIVDACRARNHLLMSQRTATQVVCNYGEAWAAGDATTVLSLYHQDLTLDWPGRHRLAGVHAGQAAAVEALLDLQAVTNRRPVEIVDVLAGEHSVIMVVRERWTTNPDDPDAASIEVSRALDFTVLDGRLRSCRIFEADQPSVDDWIDRFGVVSEG